jgi:hypothetical protein
MSNTTNFLEKLNEARQQDVVSVEIPSIGKAISFYPINVKQQKMLLRHSIDGGSGAISILKELNTIIMENCVDKTVNFLTTDKYPILLALRQQAMGNSVTINSKKYNIGDLPKSNTLPVIPTKKEINYNGFKVTLELPTLKQDNNFLVKTISETAKLGDDKVKESLTTMYVYEIAKFITTISYQDIVVTFDNISITEKKEIVESLPMKLNQQIIDFMTSVREIENKLITFNDNAVVQLNTLFLTAS